MKACAIPHPPGFSNASSTRSRQSRSIADSPGAPCEQDRCLPVTGLSYRRHEPVTAGLAAGAAAGGTAGSTARRFCRRDVVWARGGAVPARSLGPPSIECYVCHAEVTPTGSLRSGAAVRPCSDFGPALPGSGPRSLRAHAGVMRATFGMLAQAVTSLLGDRGDYEVGPRKTPEGCHTCEERTCRHF
jgi:hypothetical protein